MGPCALRWRQHPSGVERRVDRAVCQEACSLRAGGEKEASVRIGEDEVVGACLKCGCGEARVQGTGYVDLINPAVDAEKHLSVRLVGEAPGVARRAEREHRAALGPE